MKKILLVAINARYSHTSLALRYLRRYVEDLPWSVEIIEFTNRQSGERIIDDIVSLKPDAVAISVYIWNTTLVETIIPRIRERLPGTGIILGGPEVSYIPEKWLESLPEIDFIICSHGESGFRFLLERNLKHPEKIIDIENLPLNEIPFPYGEEDREAIAGRIAYYESSRGCPFRCTYCLSSRGDQKTEYRDPPAVMNEIDRLVRYTPKVIKFVDRTFNIAKEHYQPLWRHIIKTHEKSGVTFHFEIHPALLDESDFTILENCSMGIFQLEIGVQSLNRDTQEEIRRLHDWAASSRAIERLVSMDRFHVQLDLIAGLPHDTIETLAFSFNKLFVLNPDYLQLGFLKVLPGTVMEEKAREYGLTYSPVSPYQVRSTRWLSAKDVATLKGISLLVNAFYNSGAYPTTLHHGTQLFGSPYEMFHRLNSFIKKNRGELPRQKKERISLLFEFLADRDPSGPEFFRDCLTWDWCLSAGDHRLPRMLKRENDSVIKKQAMQICSSEKKEGIFHHNGTQFTRRDLRRSCFFAPATRKFRDIYFERGNCAVFLPDEKGVLFIDCHSVHS